MSQLSGGTAPLTATDIQAIRAIFGIQAQVGTQVASWSVNVPKQTLTQTGFASADAVRGSYLVTGSGDKITELANQGHVTAD